MRTEALSIPPRRRNEEVLRESEERFRLLVESVRDYAIFMLDPKGHVATWNAGAERIKGYHPDEIVGRHFSIFYPEDRIAGGFPQHELEVAAREGRFEDEGWRIRKGGSPFWANVVITALRNAKGELVGFAKVTRDLTARRAAEEQSRRLAAEEAARTEAERQSEELRVLNEQLQNQAIELEQQTEEADAQAASRAKTEFLTMMSHELRTPHNAIAGYTQLLEMGLRGAVTAEQREDLERIQRGAGCT